MNADEIGERVEQTFYSDLDYVVGGLNHPILKPGFIQSLLPKRFLATIVTMYIASESANDAVLQLEQVINNMPKKAPDGT
jgi:hypothetical protein